MSLSSLFRASAAVLMLALPATAEEAPISVSDAYARSAGHHAKSGAAFMVISNSGEEADRLLGVSSDVAKRVELHTHVIQDGIAKMRKLEEGIELASGSEHVFERGGDHVMFMGLNHGLKEGDLVTVILNFEKAGEIVVEIPVDLTK